MASNLAAVHQHLEDYMSESSPPPSSASTSSSNGHSCGRVIRAGSDQLSLSSHSRAMKKDCRRRPIIRVVHVFAPTLIQTDVSNFRALVQKLTGNDEACKGDDMEEQEAVLHGTACCEKVEVKKKINKKKGRTLSTCDAAARSRSSSPSSSHYVIEGGIAPSAGTNHTELHQFYDDPLSGFGLFEAESLVGYGDASSARHDEEEDDAEQFNHMFHGMLNAPTTY